MDHLNQALDRFARTAGEKKRRERCDEVAAQREINADARAWFIAHGQGFALVSPLFMQRLLATYRHARQAPH